MTLSHSPVAFITGAGSGMGQLYAKQLLMQGWSVAALDVNEAGLNLLADAKNLLKLKVDVCDADAVAIAVQQTESQLGPITRVVNAAAIMPFGSLLEMVPSTVHKMFDINVGGLVNVASATMPLMLAREKGEFISFASLSGIVPIFYMGAYAATKSAAVAYTEVLHHETRGQGVQVLCVCPPAVKTPLLEQGKNTRWPKFLDLFPIITPQQVIRAIEGSIGKQRFWVYPGWYTRFSILSRRWTPNFLWWFVRMVEKPKADIFTIGSTPKI